MTDIRSDTFSNNWVRPLLALGDADLPAEVRLAALMAASRFPLGATAWRELAKVVWRIVRAAPAGSPVRRNALDFAASVPLASVREVLRQMAEDPAEPDHDAIAASLEAVGDPSRIEALLERASAGDPDAFRLLAIAPLENTALTPDDIPPGTDAAFWRALAVARLGKYDALDEVFAPAAPVPAFFWGSPWVAYEYVATIRPVPEPMSNALHILSSRLDDPEIAERVGHDLARALRLTFWAASGTADAEGSPLPPPKPFGPVKAPEPFRSRKGVSSLLTEQMATERPEHDDGQIAWMIAHTPTERLIRKVVKLVRQERPLAERLRLLDILGKTADCQSGCAPTPFRGAGGSAARARRLDLIDDRTRLGARRPTAEPTRKVLRRFSIGFLERRPCRFPAILPPTIQVDVDPAISFEVSPDSLDGGRFAEPLAAGAEAPVETAAEASPAENLDERHVRARILHDGQTRNTFVAGASNTIRCWIGLPEQDGAATADGSVPTVDIPKDGLPLTVEMCWGDQRDSTKTILPAARNARSGDCDLKIEVPADERYVSAEIMFRYRGRSFEVVRIEAAALAPGQTESPRDALRVRVQYGRREVIAIDDAQPCSSTLVFGEDIPPGGMAASGGEPTLRVFDGNGGRNYRFKSPGKAIETLNAVLFSTEKSLVRRLAATPGEEGMLDANDEEVRVLLRDMARFGAGLFNQLEQQGFTDPGDRIQLLSLEPDSVLPLEFVYDRGYPVEEARLCGGWLDALQADAKVCPVCGGDPPSADVRLHAPTICPLGFWSLRKVVERLNPATAAGASAPRSGRRSLPPIDSAVFASSNKVPEDERTATWTTIHDSVGNAVLAHHWDEWHEAVKQHPRLLVALPHHDEAGVEDFLEIGDESLGFDLARLRRGQIRPDYVNPDGLEPGPILLLLGCRTGAESELGYVQVVREFQKLKTSIVLGTLAQILGRHAAPLARELVTQLVAVDDPEADFGTLMRRVRRHMLARGYLLALCLVVLGDAEWRLTPRTAHPAPVP